MLVSRVDPPKSGLVFYNTLPGTIQIPKLAHGSVDMDRKDDNQSPQGSINDAFASEMVFILFLGVPFQIDSCAGETARILVEFLEVAITSIVLLKGIYPPGLF